MIKKIIYIVVFVLLSFNFKFEAVYGDENNSSDNDRQSYQELYRIVAHNKSVTAIWLGEDPKILTGSSDTPSEYGVKELIFQFSNDNKKIKFIPGGALYFDCWSFDIFNGDGNYVVLLQSHYGPYHVIKIENLRDYLVGKSPPIEIVKGEEHNSDGGVIHDRLQWISNDTFEFKSSCCGDDRTVRHKIGFKTTRDLWRNEKDFYSSVIIVVVLLSITVTLIVAIIKLFKRKYLEHI